MANKRVLSVGQCSADHASISWMLRSHFDAEVVPAATVDEAVSKLGSNRFDLVVVNRVFDYDSSSGLDFIARLKGDEKLREVPVMLVSNYADAQQQAVERGALPGFGKSALNQPKTHETIAAVLGEPVSR